MTTVPAFSLGSFRVEPSSNRITSASSSHRVTPKAMDVLVQLAAHPGETVSRDTFLETVWRDVIVNEEVLTRAVADLRKVLADDPKNPTYIATIPKRGYRLIAPVGPLAAERVRAARSRGGGVALIAAGAIAIAVALYLAFAARSPAPDPGGAAGAAPRFLETRLLTTLPGTEIQPALSPDGSRVAFVWPGEDGDNWDVYVKSLDADGATRLTASPSVEAAPSWSPDGKRLAYMRYEENGDGRMRCSILEVEATGGEAEAIGSCGQNQSPDLAWSPDGGWLAFSDRDGPGESFALFLLSPTSGERRRLTSPDRQHWGDKDPSFSPDGRWVAFTRSVSMRTQDVFRVRVEDGELRRVTDDGREVRGHAYVPESGSLVVASARNGRRALWEVPLDGAAPTPLYHAGGSPAAPSVGAGGVIVYEDRTSDSDLLSISLGSVSGEAGADREPSVLARSTREDREPALAPDGTKLAFVSSRSGFSEVWISGPDGEQPKRLTRFDGPHVGSPRWSPDGARIAFDARPDGHADVFVVEVVTGVLERVTRSEANDLMPDFALDGASLYFGSDRNGRWEIWRAAIEPEPSRAAPERVTTGGGYAARVASDGRFLYVTKYDRPGLHRLDVGSGEEAPVQGLEGLTDASGWDFFDEGALAITVDGEGSRLRRVSFTTGTVTELGALDAQPGGGLAVDRARDRILYSRSVGAESDLVIATGADDDAPRSSGRR